MDRLEKLIAECLQELKGLNGHEKIEELRALDAREERGERLTELEAARREALAQSVGEMPVAIRRDAELRARHGQSRYAGAGASPEVVAALAAGGAVDVRTGEIIGGGQLAALRTVPNQQRGAVRGVRGVGELLRDVKAAGRGDPRAHERLRAGAEHKGITDGELLVPSETIPGYVEARDAAAPVRGLAREFQVTGREVRILKEGDQLVVDWTPEGGTKPSSDASVVEVVSLVFKPAGVTVLEDELLEDSSGLAEQIVAAGFGRAIGKKIDLALLDGTGAGQPTGVLRAANVNHVSGATLASAIDLYDAIVAAVGRVQAKFYRPSAIVMRPEHLLAFKTERGADGHFIWPDGPDFGAPIVFDSNLPVTTGASDVVVADWSFLWVFSRGGLTIESSEHTNFVSDETTYRAYERIGAAVVEPLAFEVLDDVDLS